MRPNSGLTFSIAGSGAYTIGSGSYVRSSALTLTAASYTFSAFVKKGEYDHVQFRSGTNIDTTSGATAVLVNLNNGTIVGSTGTASSIEDFGNGWYRVSHTFTATASTWYLNFWFWNTTSVTSNGTDGIYIWGAQLEAGSYATSYIPTTSASVTRVADAASKTGISSLIGQTEGTLYVEIERKQYDAQAFWVNISDNSYNNWIFVGWDGFNSRNYIRVGNTVYADGGIGNMPVGRYKIAISYKSGDSAAYVNGVQAWADSDTWTLSGLNTLNIGGAQPVAGGMLSSGSLNQAVLFKTRLTNAELASLTTL